jgi:glutaredoxin-like protein
LPGEISAVTEILDRKTRDQVREVFKKLTGPVTVLFFGSLESSGSCQETLQLAREVAALSDKIALQALDLHRDADRARTYAIDKAPTLVIAAGKDRALTDFGIRLAGLPSGHEFSSFIQDILLVSQGDSGLAPATREYLKSLTQPLTLQVFVTPTCPYCPQAVVLAHRMAMENCLIRAEMIEAMEFPALAGRYNVSGVPQTTINDGARHVVGAVPEAKLLAALQETLQAA